MKNFLKTLFALSLFAAAAVMTACGGSEPAPATAGGADTPVTFDIEGQDIAFDINDLSVVAGQEVTINFDNVGTLEHSWVLVSGSMDPLEATDSDAIRGISSGTIAGGESTTFSFKAPSAGTYLYVCTIEGHAAAGMVGELVVQ